MPTKVDRLQTGAKKIRCYHDLAQGRLGHGGRPITLEVHADPDMVLSSEAVSLGLMTTELVINAVKHAFPGSAGGNIVVQYEADAHGWHLSVADDGVGFPDAGGGAAAPGLGMSMVEALASRLDGGVEITNAQPGTIVSVTASKPRC